MPPRISPSMAVWASNVMSIVSPPLSRSPCSAPPPLRGGIDNLVGVFLSGIDDFEHAVLHLAYFRSHDNRVAVSLGGELHLAEQCGDIDRKSTRLNSSH